MDSMRKILIIEDEKMIAEGIKVYLEQNNYIVFIENNGKTGLDAFSNINPDLVILDLMLPGLSGEEVCREIRRVSRTPIIMLTAKTEERDILTGLDIGADDYVTKPFSVKQLVGRVKAVIRRTEDDPIPLFNIMTFNNNDLVIDLIKNEVKKKGVTLKLTPSEYKILLSLVKYPQKTFTREELISIALGQAFDGYDRIIDTHIKNLRQKVEKYAQKPQYVLTVRGFGYKFGGNKK